MDETIKFWFGGMAKAVEELTPEARTTFFKACGCHCVEQFVLPIYKKFYEESANLDEFFLKPNQFEGVRGEIIEPNRRWALIYEQCVCPLHMGDYYHSPHLCECSKHSILNVMHTLEPQSTFEVKVCSTVLGGDKECRMEITKFPA